MKYINADRLKAEIENLKIKVCGSKATESDITAALAPLDLVIRLIDSLQQEQPELPQIERAEYYYHKGVYEGLSQGRVDALKILDEFMKRQANPVIVIEQQEQPECPTTLGYWDLEKKAWRSFVLTSFIGIVEG